jgi:hypothetical protein
MSRIHVRVATLGIIASMLCIACGGGGGGGGLGNTGGAGGSANAVGGAGGAATGGGGGTAVVSPAWETLGGDIGLGEDPVIMLVGSTPTLGYDVAVTSLVLSSWNGTTWSPPEPDPSRGNALTAVYSGKHFCSDGSSVFMAYTDAGNGSLGTNDPKFYDRILLYLWTAASGWQIQNGGSEVSLAPSDGSDQNPEEPAVACQPGVDPAVAWTESEVTAGNVDSDMDVWAARLHGGVATRSAAIHRVPQQITSARTVGTALTPSATAYAAFLEQAVDAMSDMNLYVNRADGTAIGGVIDTTNDGPNSAPALVALSDSEMYLAWAASHDSSYHNDVFVSKWNGSAWSLVGGGPVTAFPTDHFDSTDPDLIVIDGSPIVAWTESGTQEPAGSEYIFVARYNGTSWDIIGNRINVDVARQSQDPTLAYDPSTKTLYVAFEEYVDGRSHVFVRQLHLH